MARNDLPCPTIMRLLLEYEPESGVLRWKRRPAWMFKAGNNRSLERVAAYWNRVNAGRDAFPSRHKRGYHQGKVFDRTILAHRAAWCIAYGRWPVAMVDHKNGVTSDNRLDNLRAASSVSNTWNTCAKSGASPFKGVTACRDTWRARITIDGRKVSIGTFLTEIEAAAAYDMAASKAFGEFAQLNFPAEDPRPASPPARK